MSIGRAARAVTRIPLLPTAVRSSTLRPSRVFEIFTMSDNKKAEVVEGVFAVNKPPVLTSADVLRVLNQSFQKSSLFAPLIASLDANVQQHGRHGRFKKKRRKGMAVKMGHGGTLDPLATGILIVGVGAGTKALPRYLGCTKSYETVLLFGMSSDSYDIHGNVVRTAGWNEVSRHAIQEELAKFRGKLMQKPPIYSARWVGGERLYDIARRGGEIPDDALKAREVNVSELELLEYYEEGTHNFAMRPFEHPKLNQNKSDQQHGQKRKRGQNGIKNGLKLGLDAEDSYSPTPPPQKIPKKPKTSSSLKDDQFVMPESEDDEVMSGALPAESSDSEQSSSKDKVKLPNIVLTEADSAQPAGIKYGPAVRLRMTVTSGFYVRSLCHDLAKSLGSAGVMASLVRTRQGEFALGGDNVVDLDWFEDSDLLPNNAGKAGADEVNVTQELVGVGEKDLEIKTEATWGPKVRSILGNWMQREIDDSGSSD